jgi:excisionase family DNA binding protein
VIDESTSPIFTVAEAARYLKVGPRVVYRLCRNKKVVYTEVDDRGTIRIHKDAIDDFVARRSAR